MTALETIFQMQRPVSTGWFSHLCRFEAVVWVCVVAAAKLGMNFNDGRYPTFRVA
ncbi:hypothetical protein [Neorhizobium sp. LjRoot104]|uniref:hypothetical protein n=1 Tax=Neorhizobium sp. LjRoot104 TaxID=3342254 RepID=UPI003ED0E153